MKKENRWPLLEEFENTEAALPLSPNPGHNLLNETFSHERAPDTARFDRSAIKKSSERLSQIDKIQRQMDECTQEYKQLRQRIDRKYERDMQELQKEKDELLGKSTITKRVIKKNAECLCKLEEAICDYNAELSIVKGEMDSNLSQQFEKNHKLKKKVEKAVLITKCIINPLNEIVGNMINKALETATDKISGVDKDKKLRKEVDRHNTKLYAEEITQNMLPSKLEAIEYATPSHCQVLINQELILSLTTMDHIAAIEETATKDTTAHITAIMRLEEMDQNIKTTAVNGLKKAHASLVASFSEVKKEITRNQETIKSLMSQHYIPENHQKTQENHQKTPESRNKIGYKIEERISYEEQTNPSVFKYD